MLFNLKTRRRTAPAQRRFQPFCRQQAYCAWVRFISVYHLDRPSAAGKVCIHIAVILRSPLEIRGAPRYGIRNVWRPSHSM